MNNARPQRTVSISLSGRQSADARVSYGYWSPNDGITRSAVSICDLYHERGTNTLFVLDYASTLNGWTIIGTEPNPPDAPALDTIAGPAATSLMTLFPDSAQEETFKFYIVYSNTITDQIVKFDPQEANIPPP